MCSTCFLRARLLQNSWTNNETIAPEGDAMAKKQPKEANGRSGASIYIRMANAKKTKVRHYHTAKWYYHLFLSVSSRHCLACSSAEFLSYSCSLAFVGPLHQRPAPNVSVRFSARYTHSHTSSLSIDSLVSLRERSPLFTIPRRATK